MADDGPVDGGRGMLTELAPVATPPQLAAASRVPLTLRILCGLLAAAFTAWFLWASVSGAVNGLRHPSTLDSIGQGHDRLIITNYLTLLTLGVLALVASWGVNGIRAGGFPRGAARAGGQLFVGMAALVWVPLIACTTLQVLLTLFGTVPAASGVRSSLAVGLVTSLGSGVSEEIFVVAVPVALASQLLRPTRAHPDRAPRLATTAVVVLLAAARISYHVYYGWTAVVLLPWAVLSVVVYLRTRAILPLMICHVIYDSVLQLPGLLGLVAVVLLAGVVVVLAVRRVHRSRPVSGGGPGGPWGLPAPPGPARGRTGPSPFGPPDRSAPR